MEDELVEALSDLEHVQWMHWSKNVAYTLELALDAIEHNHSELAKLLIKDKLVGWKENWKPYSDLPDNIQEFDRIWARKAIGIVQEHKASVWNKVRGKIKSEHSSCCEELKRIRKLLHQMDEVLKDDGKEDSRLKENYQRLFTEAVEIRRERDQLRKEIEKKEQEIDKLKKVIER